MSLLALKVEFAETHLKFISLSDDIKNIHTSESIAVFIFSIPALLHTLENARTQLS